MISVVLISIELLVAIPVSVFISSIIMETTISEKERQKMIIFLTLVLIILMILIGGERGAVSLMTLASNIVICLFRFFWCPLVSSSYF